jgi:hypothetical protein
MKVFFLSINICSLKVLNFGFKIIFYIFCFVLCNLYNFLGLGHASLRLFFDMVCIVTVLIGLIAKYDLDF